MEWKCDSVPPIMESMRMGSIQSIVVDSGASDSASMISTIAAVVPIIILAAVVLTLLIVAVTAVIDNRQQLLSSKQQRNSQRRGSSGSRGALIDIGLLWSALCCALSLAINKDKDNAVEQTQQQQQQLHQSAKKIRKRKNEGADHVILERIVSKLSLDRENCFVIVKYLDRICLSGGGLVTQLNNALGRNLINDVVVQYCDHSKYEYELLLSISMK